MQRLLQRRRSGIDLYLKLVVSQLADASGLLGAAYLTLHGVLATGISSLKK